MTSAKEGINVNESMKFLLEYIIDRMNKFSRENNVEFGQKRKDTIKLTKECHAIRRDRKSKFC